MCKKTSKEKLPSLGQYSDRSQAGDATHQVLRETEHKAADNPEEAVTPEDKVKAYKVRMPLCLPGAGVQGRHRIGIDIIRRGLFVTLLAVLPNSAFSTAAAGLGIVWRACLCVDWPCCLSGQQFSDKCSAARKHAQSGCP